MPPPTYQEYDVTRPINFRPLLSHPVYGNGQVDDTINQNSIVSRYADSKINVIWSYLKESIASRKLTLPPGPRIVAKAWNVVFATGSNYYNLSAPRPAIKVGSADDIGVAQFSYLLFTWWTSSWDALSLKRTLPVLPQAVYSFWKRYSRIGGTWVSNVAQLQQIHFPKPIMPKSPPNASRIHLLPCISTASSSTHIEAIPN